MPQQHIAKWRGEGDGRSLYQNSSTVSGPGWLWQETNNRTNTRIRKQTKWRTECKKKRHYTVQMSWLLRATVSAKKRPFQFEWIWIKRISYKGQVWQKKKKKTDFECAGFPCGGLFLLSLPEANVSLSVKIVCFDTGSCTVSILSKQAETHSHQTARCLGNVTLLFKGFLTYVNLSGDVVTSKSPVPVW